MYNKALHADKIKLRSFLTTLYFAGKLSRWAPQNGDLNWGNNYLA